MSNLASMRKLGPRNKPTKTKKPPIKVVYISNPMKVKTSASQFRALVQHLTGQDSELPADPTAYEDKVNSLVDADQQKPSDQQQLRVSRESSSTTTTVTTSSSEAEELGGGGGGGCCYGGDEFLTGNDQMLDGLLPVWGSEAFLCTWMC